MNKTWDDGWHHQGQDYQVRLYEDARDQEKPIFVVERADSKPMALDEARDVGSGLEARAGFDSGGSRLWEQEPEGKIFEHSYSTYEYDSNSVQSDLPPGEYSRAVNAGNLEPQMSTGYNHSKTEISPQEALETTGHEIRSYEQQRELEVSMTPEVNDD